MKRGWAKWWVLTIIVGLFTLFAFSAFAQQEPTPEGGYHAFPLVGSRIAIWIIAQLHLNFAALILGVPIFALIVEFVGVRTKDPRYDWLAKEFMKLVFAAFSTTAIFGALLLFFFITLYPRFFSYLSNIFAPSMWIYAALFFFETFILYLYYYGWEPLKERKGLHLTLGVLLNLCGFLIMVISNSWATFMMSPAGLDGQGNLISRWAAFANFTWMPINIHRLIANISFGGSIAAAYAAYRFLGAASDEERAQYDWMGYVGNFVAISALLVLPFAGYWLGQEIYAFNQQMGITMMGGFLSWLWVIQALLIGVLFLGANYYLWLGMDRIPGAERYRRYVPFLLLVLTVCFLVWFTPHSLVASLEEARRIGGIHHPLLGVLGVMSAKNTAVNLMILTTFWSFLLYRRGNKVATVPWAAFGKALQGLILVLAASIVLFFGIYGYFVAAIVRIGFSIYQVLTVLSAIVLVTGIDLFLFRRAKTMGAISWGRIATRSQYILILLAITFTWLMGLMGFARSALRQHWHVFGVMRDTSPEAYTPSLGYAANMISVIVLLFFALVAFIFWLGRLGEKPKASEVSFAPQPAGSGNPDHPLEEGSE